MEYIIFMLVVFVISYIIGELFLRFLKLPKLLGYMVVGIIINNYFDFDYLLTSFMVEMITSFALSIILLKAGLGIEKAVFNKIGFRVFLLGTVPNIIEGLVVATFSYFLLDFDVYTALMFGYIISAVSPAVVIPTMTRLLDEGYEKEVPTMSLASTSIDDVISLTIFSIFLSLSLGESGSLFFLVSEPLKFLFGIIFGGLVGFLLGKNIVATKNKYYQLLQFIFILLIALSIKQYGSLLFITEMIAIMTLGYYFNDTFSKEYTYIKTYTNNVWKYAQVYLFFTIGFLTNISTTLDYLLVGLLIITFGLIGRGTGVLISLYKSKFTRKQKSFTLIANIPKATVQAALGAVPLSLGLANGDVILSISALSIIVTAPIGLILIELFSKKLLKKA